MTRNPVIIWAFRLRLHSRTGLFLDELWTETDGSRNFGIPGSVLRPAMRTLARDTGLPEVGRVLSGPDCLWMGNAVTDQDVHIVDTVRMPVDYETGAASGVPSVMPAVAGGMDFVWEFGIRLSRDREAEVINAMAAVLYAMQMSGLRVGRLQTRGFGKLVLQDIQAGRYDMGDADGVEAFLTRRLSQAENDVNNLFSGLMPGFQMPTHTGGKSVAFRFELQPIQGIVMPEGADGLIPGTLLAGVLRHHARHVLETLGFGNPQAFVERLFGTRGMPSKVMVDAVEVTGGHETLNPRVELDVFTGGVIRNRAFERRVVVKPTLHGWIIVTDPDDAEIGLLVLVLRDLVSGRLALGAGESVGFGLCTGRVTLSRGEEQWIIGTGAGDSATTTRLNDFVTALNKRAG